MRRVLALSMVILGFLLPGVPARAAFQLVLKNGRVLTGEDLERQPGQYVLIKKDGQRLIIEMDQVAMLRIVGDDVVLEETSAAEDAGENEKLPPEGVTVAGPDLSDRVTRSEPATVGGPEPPVKSATRSGETAGGPEILAGAGPDTPLAAGEWRPQSDWPAKNPDWPRDGWISWGPDATWMPQSDYATDPNANNFNPVTWSKSPRDPTWHPTEGYSKASGSPTVTTASVDSPVKGMPPVADQSGAKVVGAAGASTAAPGAPSLAAAEGMASWYGKAFKGRTMASGRKFDPDELTAAHESLPFGTLVLVTRKDNPALNVVVEITDRGTGGRLLNLSRGAAEALDMLKLGVAPVRMVPMPQAQESFQITKPVPVNQPGSIKNPASPADGS